MSLEKEPFRKYDLEDNKVDVTSLKLNAEERQQLEVLKNIINQKKDSTAIKQLAFDIAPKVLLDEKMKAILEVVLNNYRKNQRLGVVDFD